MMLKMVSMTPIYRILMMTCLVSLVQSQTDETELTCEDIGGSCVSRDSDTCLQKVDAPGCQEEEICCEDDAFGQIVEGNELAAASEFKCKNKKLCKKQGGFCFDPFSVDLYCDIQNPNLCGKGRCSCCINCRNQATPKDCRENYGGKCQITCDSDRIHTGYCKSECKCCGCKIEPLCSSQNGYCITEGSHCHGTILDGGCEGRKCQCCVPEPKPCLSTASCEYYGGYCNEVCQLGEQVMDGVCEGTCSCCVPVKTCVNTKSCVFAGGYCTDLCGVKMARSGECEDGCTCCPGCRQSYLCSSEGGECVAKSECLSSIHRLLPSLCLGSGCVCCQLNCPQSGGYCTKIACGAARTLGMCSKDNWCCVPTAEMRDEDTDAEN